MIGQKMIEGWSAMRGYGHGTRRAARAVAALVALSGIAAPAGCAPAGGHPGARPHPTGSTWSRERLRRAGAVQHRPHRHRLRGIGHPAKPTIRNARVGALFDHDANGDHYCTASVVGSPGRDLIVTAAHCIHGGRGRGYKSDIVFVPSYRDGTAPHGEWRVRSLLVDPRWSESSDPDLDVGFVTLRPLGGRHIEDVLGGNQLGENMGYGRKVTLTGYPSNGSQPVSCTNRMAAFGAHQLRVDCTGFPGGTSGSPWLTAVDKKTHRGVIVGVIGGYQAGGSTPDVSYSPYFGREVHDLYLKAVAEAELRSP